MRILLLLNDLFYRWYNELRAYGEIEISIVVVGNKSDIKSSLIIDPAADLAVRLGEKIDYMESSALFDVDFIFERLASSQ